MRITRLAGETFLAETVIHTPDGQERVVDSRPTDAICLALVAQAPIRVAQRSAWVAIADCGPEPRLLRVVAHRHRGHVEINRDGWR